MESMENLRKADGPFGPDCLEAWSKLVLVQSKLGQGLVKGGLVTGQDSNMGMMSSDDPGVRFFWKVSCKYSRFSYFFSVKSAKVVLS